MLLLVASEALLVTGRAYERDIPDFLQHSYISANDGNYELSKERSHSRVSCAGVGHASPTQLLA